MKDNLSNPRAVRVVRTIISPVEAFLHTESASGILLMLATMVAMIWANSPWAESYEHFIHTPVAFSIGEFFMEKSLAHWVNDGLMVIFFFVVGLEIKREMALGELSTPKKAALPMFAALGGMVAPALIYTAFNFGTPGQSGWGIPMATDIAFAVGILTLMSRKTPFALKVFLLALAIVDDLGAVLVIAFFYTEEVVQQSLGTAAMVLALIYFLRIAGVKSFLVYVVLGTVVWFAILKSGVHATIAGVILGLLTPAKPFFPREQLPEKFRKLVDDFTGDVAESKDHTKLSMANEQRLEELHEYVVGARSALDRLIHVLHPWVSYAIMPIFALVNAGVHIENVDLGEFFSHPIALGVILGLLVGKPVGIMLASWIAVKLKIAALPQGVTWYQVFCVSILAAIGFTMALFIGHLALKYPDIEMYSKLGILTASATAAILGSILLSFAKDQPKART